MQYLGIAGYFRKENLTLLAKLFSTRPRKKKSTP
jgi:hypothetical protein